MSAPAVDGRETFQGDLLDALLTCEGAVRAEAAQHLADRVETIEHEKHLDWLYEAREQLGREVFVQWALRMTDPNVDPVPAHAKPDPDA